MTVVGRRLGDAIEGGGKRGGGEGGGRLGQTVLVPVLLWIFAM